MVWRGLDEVGMDTKEMTREGISAFADSECDDAHVDIVLAALRGDAGKADWEIYHQIGDALRSDDMAVHMSPGFAASMAARLDAEPIYFVPPVPDAVAASKGATTARARRWALPGLMAAAAAAAVAFVVTPQLMVAMKSYQAAESSVAQISASVPIAATTAQQATVLRDERIDDYLLAHQRFSPSVFSSAQYARSATFAADSNK